MFDCDHTIIPRAWDSRQEKGWRHYVQWYAHLTRSAYTAKMRAVFKGLRHAAVPPYMQDVLYKTAVSGHRMGSRKFGRTSDEGRCRRCGNRQPTGEWTGPDETVEHGFDECAQVALLWKMIITNWNASMLEQLDHTDKRITLLGDRGDDARAVTEEAWRVVHACAQWIIHTTRNASHSAQSGSKAYLSAPAMMKQVRKKVQELVSARARTEKGTKDTRAFREAWIDTEAALQQKDGSVRACPISRPTGGQRAQQRQAAQAEQATQQPMATADEDMQQQTQTRRADRPTAFAVFTDGAWDPEKYEFEAGAGVVEFEIWPTTEHTKLSNEYFDMRQLGTYTTSDPAPPTMGRLTHAEGIQINESGDSRPEYIGATKQSNNTAELTALYRALWRANKRPKDAPPRSRDNIHGFVVRTKRHLRHMERQQKDSQEDDPKPSKYLETSTEATRDANRKHRAHPITHWMARERASRSDRVSGYA